MPFTYSFRFCCDPYENKDREIGVLKTYAPAASVDDVMVFCNVEELNTGHMTYSEQEDYLGLVREVSAAMDPLGITTSINHWHSLMHADLGKKLLPEQHFRLMVDVDGRESDLCVCPMDEEWQNYYAGLYARYAALKPNVLWVEDDFRLHNHAPLHWGGCFCEAHMAEYSRRAGKKLTREEFIAGVLKPGEPHPYRRIWLDVNRETMRTLAERIGEAVHSVCPETRVGLMSSVPFTHCAEGRDWHGILKGFAGPNRPVSRIHLPCYSEQAPKDYLVHFNAISLANRAMIPAETQVYPELENYPYSLFAKSVAFTRFQLMAAMPLDLAGMTIDLFDLNGSGIVPSEGYQDMLTEVKSFLNAVTDGGAMHEKKLGVAVMISETSSYTLHTDAGREMEELYPQETYFGSLMPAFGIPVRYCMDPTVTGAVVAVSGQYFRNLTAAEIEHLFQNNSVILSGDAVDTLLDMGLGGLAGIASARWMQQDGGEYTYEQAEDGVTLNGMEHARASAVISSTDVLNIEYAKPHKTLTRFYSSFRKEASEGHVLLADGRVFIHPFGHFGGAWNMPVMQLNAVRRDLFLKAIKASPYADTVPCIEGGVYLEPYVTEGDGKLYCYLVNASHDPVKELRLHIGSRRAACVKVLRSDNTQESLNFDAADGLLTAQMDLAPLDCALLTLEVEQ